MDTPLCQEFANWHPNGVAPCGKPASGDFDGMPLCREHLVETAGRLIDRSFWVSLFAKQPRERVVAVKDVPTFTATIYVGFRSARTADPTYHLHTLDDARAICQARCNDGGLCVTLTPTEFIYTNGSEPGVAVGLIHYPRFPSTPEALRATALDLAERLRVGLGQYRVSVVMPDETVMLGDAD